MIQRIEQIMKHDVAGDPISGLRWTRKTRAKAAAQLNKLGIRISATTVGVLLKNMRFSLRVNRKKLCGALQTPQKRRIRNRQFGYIRRMRELFTSKGHPVISVDTKKKEQIGNFKNQGKVWCRTAVVVNDHDFASLATGKAISYGVYDVNRNKGTVCVGVSHDTAAFAADSIEFWWRQEGCHTYKKAHQLLILADSGGSNGANCKMWKYWLQKKLCDPYNLTVTVCHYPTGASKWNPIEHRLFGEISKNWAGVPLRTMETVLKFIRTTKTSAGLQVKAVLNKKYYAIKEKLSVEQEKEINMKRHAVLPKWNYTIMPKM